MKSLLRSIRTHILIGGVLVTPVAVTMWVILVLVSMLTNSKISQWLVSPVIERIPGREITAVKALVSLAVVLSLLFLVGLIFRNFLGRRVYSVLDKIMEKVPFINRVYMFVRTVSESIVSQKETMFREVVLIEYPLPGTHALAFVSAQVPLKFQACCQGAETEPHVYVFLPTTPNPTSGFMLLVPKAKTRRLDLSVTEAMRLIVSAGAAGPEDPSEGRVPSLLEKLEAMIDSKHKFHLRPKPEGPANLNLTDAEGEDHP
ncbi:MAG: DUF502 domain-containing protein [Verrucomicrobia bacterium]|nr:DUF502 domain-containing protein [Verrucomicrobiota bacterium]MCH8510393.1 DUF502 domain-containing protein [Kiritimatiellia bacterium]